MCLKGGFEAVGGQRVIVRLRWTRFLYAAEVQVMSKVTCLDRDPNHTVVRQGMHLRIWRLNGALLFTYCVTDDTFILTLSIAFQAAVGKRLCVPRESVHIIWRAVENDAEMAQCDVDVVISEIPSDLRYNLQLSYDSICRVCCDPCADADDLDVEQTRRSNCVRCQPCFLCDECHVRIGDDWVCFDCLDDEELVFLDPDHHRRAEVAGCFCDDAEYGPVLCIEPLPRQGSSSSCLGTSKDWNLKSIA